MIDLNQYRAAIGSFRCRGQKMRKELEKEKLKENLEDINKIRDRIRKRKKKKKNKSGLSKDPREETSGGSNTEEKNDKKATKKEMPERTNTEEENDQKTTKKEEEMQWSKTEGENYLIVAAQSMLHCYTFTLFFLSGPPNLFLQR